MNKKLTKIKQEIKKIFDSSKKCSPWMFSKHILVVEKFAKELCNLYPKANREIVLLSVYFHDIGRAYGYHKNHDIYGANYAKKYLKKHNFSQDIINSVYKSCKSHSCSKYKPKSIEAKILATADALSHYSKGFYLLAFDTWRKGMTFKDARIKFLEKINRDFKNKIFFKEAKQAIKPLYKAWKQALEKEIIFSSSTK